MPAKEDDDNGPYFEWDEDNLPTLEDVKEFNRLNYGANSTHHKLQQGSTPYRRYNILSIDGGGIRGVIPAVLVDYMEKYAFEYALKKGNLLVWGRKLRNEPQKIQMKEIFHSIAGTSTGAILAATLAVKRDPKSNMSYYA